MNNLIEIREYEPSDKGAVMNMIRLNMPKYFAQGEDVDLDHYLDHERELYYVLLLGCKIVGCGGINFADNGTVGKISWDIVDPLYQGKSLETQLLRYRIEVLKAIDTVERITVRTSQVAWGFYVKQGFELDEIKKNYWAKGFDMYSMEYKEPERKYSSRTFAKFVNTAVGI